MEAENSLSSFFLWIIFSYQQEYDEKQSPLSRENEITRYN